MERGAQRAPAGRSPVRGSTGRDDGALRLARRVARAAAGPRAARTLLVDLDGTLAPIAPTPERARVPEATLDALRRLARHGWTVAVVSGRPARQVRERVPLRAVRVFGSHGLEGGWTAGARLRLAPALARRLSRLAAEAHRLARDTPGVLIERKRAGLAIHDRRVAPHRRAAWRRSLERWLAAADVAGLERIDGRRVVELRPLGAHKGRVVETWPGPRRRGRDASFVALGDDRTDEDMFRAIRGRGLAIRVGAPRATAASARLASPAAVGRFLRALAALGAPARPAPRRGPARRRRR